MKTLICLKAASNRGKSTALCKLVNLLDLQDNVDVNNLENARNDCASICVWENCRIGIFSSGDSIDKVRSNLNTAIKEKCDITVLAIHGGTSEKYIRAHCDQNNIKLYIANPTYKADWINMNKTTIATDPDVQIAAPATAMGLLSIITSHISQQTIKL